MNGHRHELACFVTEFAVAPSRSAVHTSTAHGHADGDRPAHRARDLPGGRRDDFDADQRHSQQQQRRHRPQAPLVAAGLRSGSVRHRIWISSAPDKHRRWSPTRRRGSQRERRTTGRSCRPQLPLAQFVGLRRAIEAYHEAELRRGEALEGVSKRLMHPTLAATANASWPSRRSVLDLPARIAARAS
jgi:hypothetical protein